MPAARPRYCSAATSSPARPWPCAAACWRRRCRSPKAGSTTNGWRWSPPWSAGWTRWRRPPSITGSTVATRSVRGSAAWVNAPMLARGGTTARRWRRRCARWPGGSKPVVCSRLPKRAHCCASACAMTACAPACRGRAGSASCRCSANCAPAAMRASAPACAVRCWTWPVRREVAMTAESGALCREDVYAGVVTYRPELPLREEAIDAVLPQVGRLLVFDNATADPQYTAWLGQAEAHGRIDVLRSPANVGLGAAINQAWQRARAGGFRHLLLLDQDSVADPAMVATLHDALARLRRERPVAAVGPAFHDA